MNERSTGYTLVSDQSLVGQARRSLSAFVKSLGFNETDVGRAALIVTELANNLIRHAGGGEILFRKISIENQIGVEILAIDHGPGMEDVDRCLQDGFSTAGTPGTGLGAVIRQSNGGCHFESTRGQGTVVVSRLWAGTPHAFRTTSPPDLEVGAVCTPFPGETHCGDAWAELTNEMGIRTVLVADGIGHGPLAAKASQEAVRVFNEHGANTPLPDLLQKMHTSLKPTRGAAVALARIDSLAQQIHFVGIGNISCTLFSPDGSARSLVSHSGIVGHEVRKVQEFTIPWTPGVILILYSDGIQTRLQIEKYPGLLRRSPAIISGVLYRDFKRGRDDATLVVVKKKPGERLSWETTNSAL